MENISLAYLFQLALKRIWALILAVVFFAVAAFSYCKFIAEPVYTAEASILVTNGAIMAGNYGQSINDGSVKSTDISASLQLVDTVIDILKTPDIYKRLAVKLDGEYKYAELMKMVSVAQRNDETLFVDITFKTPSKKEAVKIANTFANLACDYIVEFVPYSIVKVAAEADEATKTYPTTLFTTALSGVIGGVLAYIVVFIIDMTDKAIKGEGEFVEKYDIPLIGIVPDFDDGELTGTYGKKKGGAFGSGYYK